jgi:L-threonylcarbamoyladenylate synthase
MPRIIQPTPDAIAEASALLAAGQLVAFPTETVYGLGGNAHDDHAVAAIYAAKGRPQFNPLIVHVAERRQLVPLVTLPEAAEVLAEAFWPGPLTLVLPRVAGCPVSLLASAGMDTLAVRLPSHPVAQALLRQVKLPIVAPSANRSGKISPTSPLHVAESLGEAVSLILAGGNCDIGLESTVVDCTGPVPVILRDGGITREALRRIVPEIVAHTEATTNPKSPGQLASHYAPDLPIRLNATSVGEQEALLAFGPDIHFKGGLMRLNLSPEGNLQEAGANLFAMLRQLNRPEFHAIAVMPIPEIGLGIAINDRLRRAAVRDT